MRDRHDQEELSATAKGVPLTQAVGRIETACRAITGDRYALRLADRRKDRETTPVQKDECDGTRSAAAHTTRLGGR